MVDLSHRYEKYIKTVPLNDPNPQQYQTEHTDVSVFTLWVCKLEVRTYLEAV